MSCRAKSAPMGAQIAIGAAVLSLSAACTPTVRVVAPSEPITINLNINITQDIRVRMAPEIEGLINENPDLF